MVRKKTFQEKVWNVVAKRMVRQVKEAPYIAEVKKDLSDSRVAFITTAGVHLKIDPPFDTNGDYSYRIIPGDSKEDELMITHTHYDHSQADQDLNVVFPLGLLQEFEEKGIIGSLAPRHIGMMGYMPQVNRLVTGSGSEIANIMEEDQVDICLLSPG